MLSDADLALMQATHAQTLNKTVWVFRMAEYPDSAGGVQRREAYQGSLAARVEKAGRGTIQAWAEQLKGRQAWTLHFEHDADVLVDDRIWDGTRWYIALGVPEAGWEIGKTAVCAWLDGYAATSTITIVETGAGVDGLAAELTAYGMVYPSVLGSDSFDRADAGSLGSTDGLGHTWRTGGSGLVWVNQIGTWGITSNRARALSVVSNAAVATVDTGERDGVVIVTPSAYLTNSMGMALRYVDANNYIRAAVRVSDGAVTLSKVIGGVSNVVLSATGKAVVTGQELVVTMEGNTFRLFYNGEQIGTAATISDAVFATSTLHGIFVTAVGSPVYVDSWAFYDLNRVAEMPPAVQLIRQDDKNWLIRQRISGEADYNLVAEWTLKKVTDILSGQTFASQVFTLGNGRVIDLEGVVASVPLMYSSVHPTQEYAFLLGADADVQGDYQYVGGYAHQFESLNGLSVTLNDIDIEAIPFGVAIYGDELVFEQEINHHYPKTPATIAGMCTLTHTWTRNDFLVDHVHEFEPGYQYYSYYSGMLVGVDTSLNQYQVDGFEAAGIVNDDTNKQTGSEADGSQLLSSSHDYVLRMELPYGGPDIDGDWSHAGGLKHFVRDLATDQTKIYATYVSGSDGFAGRIAAGDTSHRTRYKILKAA